MMVGSEESTRIARMIEAAAKDAHRIFTTMGWTWGGLEPGESRVPSEAELRETLLAYSLSAMSGDRLHGQVQGGRLRVEHYFAEGVPELRISIELDSEPCAWPEAVRGSDPDPRPPRT